MDNEHIPVNQLEIKGTEKRIPDGIVYINGLPMVVLEFKSAVKETARPVSAIKIDSSISERKLNFSTEIDVRGERLNDAVEKVTRYVDDAVMLGVSSVRIIHGKGTGVLRDELQKLIRTIPGVASVRDEHIQFGGTGVTIVNFE